MRARWCRGMCWLPLAPPHMGWAISSAFCACPRPARRRGATRCRFLQLLSTWRLTWETWRVRARRFHRARGSGRRPRRLASRGSSPPRRAPLREVALLPLARAGALCLFGALESWRRGFGRRGTRCLMRRRAAPASGRSSWVSCRFVIRWCWAARRIACERHASAPRGHGDLIVGTRCARWQRRRCCQTAPSGHSSAPAVPVALAWPSPLPLPRSWGTICPTLPKPHCKRSTCLRHVVPFLDARRLWHWHARDGA